MVWMDLEESAPRSLPYVIMICTIYNIGEILL
jgi:hypothetical protein